MKKAAGFTLVEIMITLIIVGILLVVGVPSLQSFLQNNRLIASTNALVSAFHVARSEAIKNNSRVSICESDDGESCSETGSWRDGWIVFVDSNGDLANTGAPCAAPNTDCLLRIHDGYDDQQLSITGADADGAAVSSFTFTSRGLPKLASGEAASGVFSVCMYDGSNNVTWARAVILNLSGRVRVSDNAAVINCPASP
jgi:type IV fimbrial biogenesis protein FimT